MGNLSKSFVRGFGGTLGVFAAKGLLDVARDPNFRVGGLETKRQWKAIILWVVITTVLGFTLGTLPALLFFFVGIVPLYLFQMWIQRKEEKKDYEEERNSLMLEIQEVQREASKHGIKFDLDWSGEVENYHLRNTLERIKQKTYKTIFLQSKYEGEVLSKLINNQIWLGMSKENLIDIKGSPSQIESSENSKTITEILIYGKSKRSGDVFTFKNGILADYKDR